VPVQSLSARRFPLRKGIASGAAVAAPLGRETHQGRKKERVSCGLRGLQDFRFERVEIVGDRACGCQRRRVHRPDDAAVLLRPAEIEREHARFFAQRLGFEMPEQGEEAFELARIGVSTRSMMMRDRPIV
jgi:hypothetical protein